VPLLIPALAGAAPAPLTENQLDGVTAGAVTDSSIACLAPCSPTPVRPVKWYPPKVNPAPKPYPPTATTMALGEEGGYCPVIDPVPIPYPVPEPVPMVQVR
jgi:hypothetical protein